MMQKVLLIRLPKLNEAIKILTKTNIYVYVSRKKRIYQTSIPKYGTELKLIKIFM